MIRGDVWWADLADPIGSAPGYRRPVLIVQADEFNRSRIGTVVVVALTSTMRLLDAPGNVLITRQASGLDRDSVANVSQIWTLDRDQLRERVGRVPRATMTQVADGLTLVLGLRPTKR